MKKHTVKRKKALLLAAVIALALLLSACGEAAQYDVKVDALNTTVTLTAFGKKADGALRNAAQTVTALDSMVDPELTTSVCYAINHAQGEQINITGQVADMLLNAQEVYERSEGAYDLSVYPILELWGFNDGKYYVPTDLEIADVLLRECMGDMSVNKFPVSGTYSVSIPSYGEICFDSCDRGCACKYAVEAMSKAGVESGIVSMPGCIQTLGLKPDGSNWNIGIIDPNSPGNYLGVLTAGETAVVTSAAYMRQMPGFPKYHHIFNPASGYPVSNSLLSVTIVCDDGTLADCLSTAMYVMGQTKALNYWRTYGGFDMIIINNSGEVICTSGLLERFDLKNGNYSLSFVE